MVKAWKLILAIIVFVIISQVIYSLCAMATMDYYTDIEYSSVWSKIMMPEPGPPPMEFYYYSITFAAIT